MKHIILLFSFLVLSLTVFAQSKTSLEKKRKSYIKQIEYSNRLLAKNKRKQSNTLSNLKIINSQIESRQNLITTVEYEIDLLTEKIDNNLSQINELENQINALKSEYSKIIYHAYRNKKSTNIWLFIFSSNSFNQAYRRYRYFVQYTKIRKIQKDSIVKTQEVLNLKNNELTSKKNEKRDLLFVYAEEAKNLRDQIREKRQIISNLKTNEKRLKSEIEKNKKLEKQIANRIAKLIREERKRSESESKKDNFITNKFLKDAGKIMWPVSSGIIVSEYGEHSHPVLQHIKINNPGIDISTNQNSYVYAVHEGEVSNIYGIYGTNNTVIMKHGSFYTVYQNVVDLEVKSGTKLKKGDRIGKVYTDDETKETLLHFQIWNGKNTVDPLQWITKNYN